MGYGYPLAGSCRYETLGAATGTGKTLTASGSTNVKGSYTVVGTASYAYDGFFVDIIKNASAAANRGLMDIAVNTGGSDQIIVSNLPWCVTATTNTLSAGMIFIPVKIPAGAVVKARIQSPTASTTIAVLITGYQGSENLVGGASQAINLTSLSNSDPANTLTLNGTTQTGWTQITPASGIQQRISGLILRPTDLGSSLSTAASILVDIGYGTSGSQQKLFTSLISNNANDFGVFAKTAPCDFPVGTSLWFRAQASLADTGVFGMFLMGLAG